MTKPSEPAPSAMKAAFAAAGVVPARERLIEIGCRHWRVPGDFGAWSDAVVADIGDDAALVWALMDDHTMRLLLNRLAALVRERVAAAPTENGADDGVPDRAVGRVPQTPGGSGDVPAGPPPAHDPHGRVAQRLAGMTRFHRRRGAALLAEDTHLGKTVAACTTEELRQAGLHSAHRGRLWQSMADAAERAGAAARPVGEVLTLDEIEALDRAAARRND